MMKRKNPLWLHGFNPAEIPEYLSKFNLSVVEDVGSKEFLERYIKPNGRTINVMDIERTVLAAVK